MKAWKEKKRQRRLENERARKDSNPATGVNASDASNVSSGARNDLSEVTCFNCDKKGHFRGIVPNPGEMPQNTSDSLGNLRADDWG